MNFLPLSGRRSAWRAPCARCVLLLALLVAPPLAALAQETVNYASVSGRVTDPQGAVVAGRARDGPPDRDQH